jgi:hypothetical protein
MDIIIIIIIIINIIAFPVWNEHKYLPLYPNIQAHECLEVYSHIIA